MSNPNFPPDLHIHPSSAEQSNAIDNKFGFLAQESAIRKYGIAGRVWEAAYAMTLYVCPPPNLIFDPPFIDRIDIDDIDASTSRQRVLSILELGSGTGLVASSIAAFLKPGRDRLIVTDLPEVCSLLEHNLQSIKRGFVAGSAEHPGSDSAQDTLVIRPLSWGSYEDAKALASEFFVNSLEETLQAPLTHIICSDLVYFPELLAPLLRSLLHLTSPPFIDTTTIKETGSPSLTYGYGPSILISYKIRSLAKETPFWSSFGLWFSFSPVLVKDNDKKQEEEEEEARYKNTNESTSPASGSDSDLHPHSELASESDAEWHRFGTDFDDTTFLFIAHRREESLTWTIPTNDTDLLQGVGANGTDQRKGDDTFENLLLMSLEQD